ncbi:hypothetical protein ACJX0J_021601, partial [Zea mays]
HNLKHNLKNNPATIPLTVIPTSLNPTLNSKVQKVAHDLTTQKNHIIQQNQKNNMQAHVETTRTAGTLKRPGILRTDAGQGRELHTV